ALFAPIVFLVHLPYLGLPYFWDELGQFVPAALDILHDGAWIPHSAVPNSHPPGVMAYLALVWRLAGYSIVATRSAMLALAAAAVVFTFFLGREICGRNTPAVLAAVFLLLDPLFYAQSMMAQLDMPAMLFTVLSLLLFLTDRHRAAAIACTALVLAKETGILLPLIFILVLYFDPAPSQSARSKYAAYYLAPFAALAIWFFLLWHSTGQIFGNPGFARYNTTYALNPVRAAVALLRRIYYLFIDDFRWVGSLAILTAWKRTRLYSTRAWKILWCFIAAHTLLVSFLGGAGLERYLVPLLPLVYIAMGAAFGSLQRQWRYLAVTALAAGLLGSIFLNPPFPFPYENNLAVVDFVELHRSAAQFLEKSYPANTVYTAWPLTQALRNPAFGYVDRSMSAAETSDLRFSTLDALNPKSVDVLVLYSRTWEPRWGVLHWPLVRSFLSRYYEYEREMTPAEVRQHFGLVPIQRWDRRGQWIEVFSRPRNDQPFPFSRAVGSVQ
ncbi:MAG: glycosyltransferase family 39 protein, partial [Bryobacterales bacterium]|nr:glycosyltransferase family 39 protein [Bryobacterales bacterium]